MWPQRTVGVLVRALSPCAPPTVPAIVSSSTAFWFSTGAAAPTKGTPVDVAAAVVKRRDADLRATYDAILDTYPAHAQPSDGHVGKDEAYRKRLVYRSKQRGWYGAVFWGTDCTAPPRSSAATHVV